VKFPPPPGSTVQVDAHDKGWTLKHSATTEQTMSSFLMAFLLKF